MQSRIDFGVALTPGKISSGSDPTLQQAKNFTASKN
jgi:hypothetical protein